MEFPVGIVGVFYLVGFLLVGLEGKVGSTIEITVIAEDESIPKWKINESVKILQEIYEKSRLNLKIRCKKIEYASLRSAPSHGSDIHSDYEGNIEGIALFNGLKDLVVKMKEKQIISGKNDPVFFLHTEEETDVLGASIEGGIFKDSAIAVFSVRRKDTPKEIGEAMAHELAHLLGSKHDGDRNPCSPTGYLMESFYTRSKTRKKLSQCSEQFIEDRMKKMKKNP